MTPHSSSTRVHLWAALVALCLLVAAVTAGSLWTRAQVRSHFVSLLPLIAESKNYGEDDPDKVTYLEHLKNLGISLQREAFARPDQLPLYGSSELVRHIPDKAGLFFQNFPTGFSVFPVGRAGTDTLLFLQNIAALGDVTAGKRVAISLSPSWFYSNHPPERSYLGNFSRSQALCSLLNFSFSFSYRRDLARRLLLHPASLERDPLLRFIADRLAVGNWKNRAIYSAAWPLAELEKAIRLEQDHFEIALYLEKHSPHHLLTAPPVQPAHLDWDRLVADASAQPTDNALEDPALYPTYLPTVGSDRAYRDYLQHAPEWADLKLLVHGLHELGVNTLFLCMPPQESYYGHAGISKESLALFAAKIHEIAGRWGAEVEGFEDHGNDLNFLDGHGDHLSNRGWMYYNRALDEFYHTPVSEPTPRGLARNHHRRPHTA